MARAKLLGQALAVALVAALVVLLIWKVAHGSGRTAQPENFTLPRLDRSGELELASLRGKVVVLNFWASWCIPCKQEARTFEEVSRQYRSKGVVVLGVDSKDASGDARSFMRRYGVTYPVVHDGAGDLWGSYGISFLPVTRVLDRKGKYFGESFDGGPVPAADLRQRINAALRA
jgi:cytochrome c biogenesis protein CcmG, thiol:disulfide interchange protein DsbE